MVISGGVEIGDSCFIGVNATLRDHVKVGERCVIGAGCLISSDAEPEGVYVGAAAETITCAELETAQNISARFHECHGNHRYLTRLVERSVVIRARSAHFV